MKTLKRTLLLLPVLGLAQLAQSAPLVGSHTWDFTEVYSNADGTIQFIELRECCGGAGETGLPGHTLSSSLHSWVIPGPALTPPTSNKHFLIATAAFAALPGAPVPDRIIPGAMVPFFSPAGDSLTYAPWDTWAFGAIPIDGVNSLQRTGMTGVNDPTNYAGGTGAVNGAPPPSFYCTAKTTSTGCLPFLSVTGDASATMPGQFNIISDDHVEGQIAIYLYGPQKANLDFHGGKLCVKAPFKRLNSLIKTADAIPCVTCAGNCRMVKRNFNALIQSGADPTLTAGASVRVQVRQRDPGNTVGGFEDNLSDAVAFTIGP
jgi:hypothetical protein